MQLHAHVHLQRLLPHQVPSILANLEHRHSYVRRNAVLSVSAMYKLPKVRVPVTGLRTSDDHSVSGPC